ncbi:MAG: aldo/keto reductase [Planctomycetota bacterium]
MQTRKIGRTNIEVPVLGLGGIPLRQRGVEDGAQVVAAAFDKGIKFIDTARGYETEPTFGAVLKDRRDRDGIIVATKSPAKAADKMRADLETSLRELQVNMIDIYQCHAVNNDQTYEQVMGPDGALSALQKARDEGLIRFIGLTSHRYDILVKGMKSGEFDTIMVQHSFVDYEAETKIFTIANDLNIGVLVMKAMAGGVIDRPGPALRYVMQFPVSAIPVGMSKVAEVEENVAIMEGDLTLTDEDRAYIEKTKKENEGQFCRRCGYCMPCPEKITIPMVMSFDSVYKRFGWQDNFLQWAERAAACKECGECEEKCPYELPIREILPKRVATIREAARKAGKAIPSD